MSFSRLLLLRRCFYIPSSTSVVNMSTVATFDVNDVEMQSDPRLANAKPFDEIPKITSLPFIGSSWIYYPFIGRYKRTKLHLADHHKHQVYGDVVREQIGNFTIVSSYRAEDMETLARHEGKYPFAVETSALKVYRESRKHWYPTSGLIVLRGEEWHELRSLTQPHLMKPKSILFYLDSMQEIDKDLVSRIRDIRGGNKEVPDLTIEMKKWALETIVFVGLDTRLGNLDKNQRPDSDGFKMISAVQNMLSAMDRLMFFSGSVPFWKYFPTPTWRRFTKASDMFSELAYKFINNSMKQLENNHEDKELTMLQAMLSSNGFDVKKVMVTAADMMMAGIESTGNSAAFLLYNLAKYPEKQEKLFQELKRVFPSKSDKITKSSFNELRYLKSCLKESLRLFPFLRGALRTLDHDVAISGYRVPAGIPIWIMQDVLTRSEKYFKDPNEFIPERWTDKGDKSNPFACLSFGYGPRSCIGRRLAEFEIICLVTEVLRNFRLEYHYEDIDILTKMTNVPDRPLKLKFIDREDLS